MAGSSPFNVMIFLSLNLLNSVKKHLGKTPLNRSENHKSVQRFNIKLYHIENAL